MTLFKKLSTPLLTLAIIATSFAGLAFMPNISEAACPMGFTPPGRIYHPDDNTQALVTFDNGMETLVLEPSWSGDAIDFGLVLPLPSKPEITEGPHQLFTQLENYTNPEIDWGDEEFQVMSSPSIRETDKIEIIEEKQVGDFDVTVLKADTNLALTQWLVDNDYTFTSADVENFAYYVEKGGFFFVTMKVNLEHAKVMRDGTLRGKLRPIEFTFTTDTAMLPLRSMKSEMSAMSFTVYTLADQPLFIPGVTIQYSQQLDRSDFPKHRGIQFKNPSLMQWYDHYEIDNKWLVRNHVQFDPKEIREDLFFHTGNSNLTTTSVRGAVRALPELLPIESGIKTGWGRVLDIGNTITSAWPRYSDAIESTHTLRRGMRGDDVKALQRYLVDIMDIGIEIDGVFGRMTKATVEAFQERYGLERDGFVGNNTKAMMKLILPTGPTI